MKVLSEVEVTAIEEMVLAAIRWTDTGKSAQVLPNFKLLMADYRRLRKLNGEQD